MTTREESIRIIEGLWPADSEYDDTAEVGMALLKKARHGRPQDWRNESDEVLHRYAELCLARDMEQATK